MLLSAGGGRRGGGRSLCGVGHSSVVFVVFVVIALVRDGGRNLRGVWIFVSFSNAFLLVLSDTSIISTIYNL